MIAIQRLVCTARLWSLHHHTLAYKILSWVHELSSLHIRLEATLICKMTVMSSYRPPQSLRSPNHCRDIRARDCMSYMSRSLARYLP